MKMEEALSIIDGEGVDGYMIHFERKENGFLISGFFPEKNEELIKTEDEAWQLAKRFASKTKGIYVNIYVIFSNFKPVPSYKENMIENR